MSRRGRVMLVILLILTGVLLGMGNWPAAMAIALIVVAIYPKGGAQ